MEILFIAAVLFIMSLVLFRAAILGKRPVARSTYRPLVEHSTPARHAVGYPRHRENRMESVDIYM